MSELQSHMSEPAATIELDAQTDLAALRRLARQLPSLDAAIAELARLSAELTLEPGAIHVISDVHGEYAKLRHVINNASGTLRPLVHEMFAHQLSPAELQELLGLIFYPFEVIEQARQRLTDAAQRRAFCETALRRLFLLGRRLARRFTLDRASSVVPAEYRQLFSELFFAPSGERGPGYLEALVDSLIQHDHVWQLLRVTARVVRNLAIDELILAGDCWDRGPRGDLVVDYLQKQPHVTFIWGNHDVAWLGACLGQLACLMYVLRVSLRYRRTAQLEEGYGIPLQPLEHLARTVYADDPAERFRPKTTGLRESQTVARMHKAALILQMKLEGQTIARNPQWGLDNRRLLHCIDLASGTIEVDGTRYPLLDKCLPTLDPADPYALSPAETACVERMQQIFRGSAKLWDHMQYLAQRGRMYVVRSEHLIFHGCVPVDEQGAWQCLEVDGQPRCGRELFDALERVLSRAVDRPTEPDLDLLWYLWCGPLSPLFGKDRITTLERDLVADPHTHHETKNPYFTLLNEQSFCRRVLAEFGVDPLRGMIVNGHVPVKIEKGESPIKGSGQAVTIDGAFSQAYGDHGYTLVIEPDCTTLARHHQFESVEAAVREGVDIIPSVAELRRNDRRLTVGDTERGAEIRAEIRLLEALIDAYRSGRLRPHEV